MDLHRFFSPDYAIARARFRAMTEYAGGRLESYDVGQTGPDGQALTMDVGFFGRTDAPKRLVLSSGTHGVEGFFGAAVQLAFIEKSLKHVLTDPDLGVLLIHAVNPYGFAYMRRVNEDNADLNRNFLLEGEAYEGADPAYANFDPLLNPQSPPSGPEMFYARAGYNIWKHGLPALKQSLVQGQYDFPKGLFFGGSGPSRSHKILKENLPRWLGGAEQVMHIDYHTGLGSWGTYVLAPTDGASSDDMRFLNDIYGSQYVQKLDPNGVLYEIRGAFGRWCTRLVPEIDYQCVLAEFGTYPILFVLDALREENRAHHWGTTHAFRSWVSKVQLKEAFVPRSSKWRSLVVERGLGIASQAIVGLHPRLSAGGPAIRNAS